MISQRKVMLIASIAYCFSMQALAADDKKPELLTGASTEMIVENCAGCHGLEGNSNGPAIPTIAGMSAAYIEDVMKTYASGERHGTIMNRIAKGYNDDEFKQMGEYFSKQKFIAAKMTPEEGHKDESAKGAKLHKKYCEKCHSDDGSNPEDDSGILKGQWTPYLEARLHDAKEGKSEMPKKMTKKLKKLHKKAGEKGLHAIMDFYAK